MQKPRKHWMVTAGLAATLFAGSWACKKQEEAGQEDTAPLTSTLEMGSRRAERQLLSGFWQVENNAWRWTKHDFSVLLLVPVGAAQKGAMLRVRFTLPDNIVAKRHSVTLSASVDGVALPPETYTAGGVYQYEASVPATAFRGGSTVKAAFSTDNYLAAGEIEARELALVVSNIALRPQ
jgi:hypothetical protein